MSSRKEEWGLLGTIAATLLAVVLMITVGGLESITNRDGGTIYNAYCVNCHGANGRGNGIAADFVGDLERMAKSDEELLLSIREGTTGKIGRMPGWENTLTEEQMIEVLKYIRRHFQLGAIE